MIGMDMTKPHQMLEGSCYWVPNGLFLMMLESRPSEPDSWALTESLGANGRAIGETVRYHPALLGH
ncbi:MAG TPA: hypothetical protein DIC57_00865 [Sphaerochaeta sp.]|nr:hypothetical protein [Sphaerochaeta sp.]